MNVLVLSVLSGLAFEVASHPPVHAPAPDSDDFGAFVAHAIPEAAAVVAGAALVYSGALGLVEPAPALLGPRIRLDAPDLNLLFDPRLDDVIGKPMLQEKVPAEALAGVLFAGLIVDAGLDLAAHHELKRASAVLLGGLEAVVGAAVVTEVFKLSFGRLRPDFRERLLRAACGGAIARPAALDCTGVIEDGFIVDRPALYDGMKSFSSGHAASAFAAATFISMHLGSGHLWGKGGDDRVRPLAALGIGGILTGAAFVAASRVADHKHHLEDVVVGAGIGTASGLAAWLLHFTLEGAAHGLPPAVVAAPFPLAGGGGLMVRGALSWPTDFSTHGSLPSQ